MPDDPVVSDEEAYGAVLAAGIWSHDNQANNDYAANLYRAAVKRGLEMAANVVHPWPEEPPHVNVMLSRRKAAILALAERVEKEGRS